MIVTKMRAVNLGSSFWPCLRLNHLKKQQEELCLPPTPGTHESLSIHPRTSCSSRIKGPGLSYRPLSHTYSAEASCPLCRSSLPLKHLWHPGAAGLLHIQPRTIEGFRMGHLPPAVVARGSSRASSISVAQQPSSYKETWGTQKKLSQPEPWLHKKLNQTKQRASKPTAVSLEKLANKSRGLKLLFCPSAQQT